MIASAPSATSTVQEAANRLLRASRLRQPCAPVRDLIDSTDIDDAYAVQRLVNAHRIDAGSVVVGRKIGLTSPAVQAQLGVDQPDFGVLFDDMGFATGDVLPTDRLLQPKVEAEVAFVLREDLAEGLLDDAQVRAAAGTAVAAIEIVDSRVRDWDITFADTVADNASSGLYVLGDHQVPLSEFEPVESEMTMWVGDEPVSSGNGRACLGDPLTALVWLARTARDLGDPLRSGQVVLSGALGPMAPARAGDLVRAEISGLGAVEFSFAEVES